MPRYLPAGECALVVEFGETADPAFHDQVVALDAALALAPIEGIRETVPTYRSLMIHFDPRGLTTADLIAKLMSKETSVPTGRAAGLHWRIPACYDPPHGEDLAELAGLVGLDPAALIELHSSATYKVVMYGFAPGFVFLAGLPPALAVSRRKTPRPPAEPGALTIANGQALIASIAMPTGWYVLGRTPVRTFDLRRDPVFPIAIGDTLSFERIDDTTFATIEAEVKAGHNRLTPSRR